MTQDKTIRALNDLIETCKDGEYGFRASAEQTKSTELRQWLDNRADDCARAADELQAQVIELGGEPDTGGSMGGAMHRGWVAVRGTLAGYSDDAVLEECERGEDAALKAYGDVSRQPLPEPVLALVERQHLGVQRNHAMIRELRDRVRGSHQNRV